MLFGEAFGENLIIHASPSKSGSDWWYGTVEKSGEKGFLPSSYVAVIDQGKLDTTISQRIWDIRF